jgi:Predicted signal transduction protein with a C-terminal ATPase domain
LKQLFAEIKGRFKRLNFNRKIRYFLIAEILAVSVIVLIFSAISSELSIRHKTGDLAMKQIDLVANTLETFLKNIDDSTELLMYDSRIQQYLDESGGSYAESITTTNQVNSALTYMMSTKTQFSYMAVINDSSNSMIYVGTPILGSDFIEQARRDYRGAAETPYGNMKFGVSHKIFYPDQYSLNIYQPLYDEYEINKEKGLLCISIDEKVLGDSYNVQSRDLPFDIYLTDSKGKIISNPDQNLILTNSPYAAEFTGTKGYFEKNDHLVVYQYIKSWDWYVVGTIKNEYLYSDIYRTNLVLVLLVGALCLISVFISLRLSNSLYKPLKDIVYNMGMVSGGDLKVRMHQKYDGDDFRQLAAGFNEMLDEIGNLMVKVKEEQHQIEQIKLNALQAQIKPHFLYNTLDCIHWQALTDGNEKVSKMVKALARYYRLCLSGGQDIIPLSQEIEHVKSYLIIQNMRYSDIIESRYEIDERYNLVRIPKMTLQPLVENSINHGINVKEGHMGVIVIRADEQDGCVVIFVEDSGAGMTQEKIDEINGSLSEFEESGGYGVQNVHKRIQLLFGEQYGLYYRKNGLGGITVEIRLPRQ